MKKIYIIIFMIGFISLHSQGNFVWVKRFGGGATNTQGNSVTADVNGNVITTGMFDGPIDFDPGPGISIISPTGNFDIYVSKLDAAGNFIWATNIGVPSDYLTSHAITTDASGNIYVAGEIEITSNIYIFKLDPLGNLIWDAEMIGDGSFATAVAVDGSGNVYTTGEFNYTVDFDPGPGVYNLTANPYGSTFISKLNSSGAFVWAKQLTGNMGDMGNSIALDNTGNVYFSGYFNDTIDFDPGPNTYTIASFGAEDMYIAKLTPSGNFSWAKQMGGTGDDGANSIKVDGAGNIYTTGFFSGIGDLDPGPGVQTFTSYGSWDIYVNKLDPAGNLTWAKQMGGSGSELGFSLDIDASGNVYSTGIFANIADFDPAAGIYNLSSNGGDDIFISKLDASGNFGWAKAMGSVNNDLANSLSIGPLNSVYSTGDFKGTVDFDTGPATYTLTSLNYNVDAYIHKIYDCTAPTTPTNTTPILNQNICNGNSTNITAAGTGTISWYTTPASTLVLGSGTIYTTPTLSIGTYTYYAEAFTCTISASRAPVTVTVTVCNGIANNPNKNSVFKISPNPTGGLVNIEMEKEISSYEILDLTGKVILKEKGINSPKLTLNLNQLQNSIYFIRLTIGDGETLQGKIIMDK